MNWTKAAADLKTPGDNILLKQLFEGKITFSEFEIRSKNHALSTAFEASSRGATTTTIYDMVKGIEEEMKYVRKLKDPFGLLTSTSQEPSVELNAFEKGILGTNSELGYVPLGTISSVDYFGKTVSVLAKGAKFLGQALTIVGATAEAQRTSEQNESRGVDPLNDLLWFGVTFFGVVAAGVIDDAYAIEVTAISGSPAPVMDSWDQYNADQFNICGENQ